MASEQDRQDRTAIDVELYTEEGRGGWGTLPWGRTHYVALVNDGEWL